MGQSNEHRVMGTEFSIPTTDAHADFIAELLNVLTLPQKLLLTRLYIEEVYHGDIDLRNLF